MKHQRAVNCTGQVPAGVALLAVEECRPTFFGVVWVLVIASGQCGFDLFQAGSEGDIRFSSIGDQLVSV